MGSKKKKRPERAKGSRGLPFIGNLMRAGGKHIGKEDGFFDPEGMYRRINQEAVVLLGGGYAILLQLAHPFVAAGVDDHSNFRAEILQRLYRTVMFEHNLVFESRERARESLKHFHAMHERIQGVLRHRSGNFPAETPYSGNDPNAKLWVHLTFVDTSLKLYEEFIRPLNTEEHNSFYEESHYMASLLEIPREIVPPTYREFCEYMDEMLSGNTLAVTETSYRLGQAVLYPENVGMLPKMSARLLRLTTAAILPNRFRKAYGLKWDWKEKYLYNSLRGGIRFLRPVAHPWVWQSPLLKGKLARQLLWGSGISGND